MQANRWSVAMLGVGEARTPPNAVDARRSAHICRLADTTKKIAKLKRTLTLLGTINRAC